MEPVLFCFCFSQISLQRLTLIVLWSVVVVKSRFSKLTEEGHKKYKRCLYSFVIVLAKSSKLLKYTHSKTIGKCTQVPGQHIYNDNILTMNNNYIDLQSIVELFKFHCHHVI